MSFCQDLLNGKYNLVLFLLVFVLIFHCYYTRPEKMEGMADTPTTTVTDDIKKAISDEIAKVYSADVEAIRNLSNVANELYKKDGFIITPGNLTVKQNTKTQDQVLKITDNKSWLSLNSSLGKGNWNPLVNDNDKGIIFRNDTVETGSLVIGPHSAESNGLKINNKGNIGIGKQPTDNKLDINGNVGIDGNVNILGNDISFTGTNNWIIRKPKDGNLLSFAPRKADNSDWDFDKGFKCDNNGKLKVNSIDIGTFNLSDVNGELVISNNNKKYVGINNWDRLRVYTNDDGSRYTFINTTNAMGSVGGGLNLWDLNNVVTKDLTIFKGMPYEGGTNGWRFTGEASGNIYKNNAGDVRGTAIRRN